MAEEGFEDIYNAAAGGSRSVTPFVDEVPRFDWHTDRNLFNFAPGKMPRPNIVEVYKDSKQRARIEKIITHYIDHHGNKWNHDYQAFTGKYHGIENLSMRGTGRYIGCQAVYTPEKKLMTEGPQRSTFD